MRTTIYNLNLRVGSGIPPIVKVSQGDEARPIGFRLFDGALAYFPTATAVITITGTKPSGLGFTETCTVSGAVATVETTLAMTQESGQINTELRITDGTLNVGTTNFVLQVEPAPHPSGTTDGTTEEARTILEQCAQYAQEAHEAAGDVAPQVESLVDAAVADKMEEIEGAVQSVTDAATQAVNDINAAGEAVEESIPADYTALSTQVSQLQADLGALVPTDLAKGTTYTSEKYINYANGNATNSSACKATDYIDITGITNIVYTRIYSASTSSYQGIAFYDEGKVFIPDSGVRISLNNDKFHYGLSRASVPEDAKYIRLTANISLGDVSLYDADDYDSKAESRLNSLESGLASVQSGQTEIKDSFDNILGTGYYTLPSADWERGGYTNYNGTDSRAYRVRYKKALNFPYPVYLLADVGYKVDGFKSDGTSIGGPDTAIKIPANTSFKIFVRKFTENTSETVDVETFAGAVKLSTALAPISLYEPTFTDVSMFERMGVSGDSYAAGGGIISGITALTWGKNLQRQSGVQVDIYAKSGDNIMDWVVNQTKGLPALLAGTECGLYWFQHGINGTSTAAMLGTAADMEADPKPNTFYGQYAYAIEAVKAAFPKARIVLATIVGSDWALAQNNYTAANTAIKAIAEYEGVPCIDISEDDFFRSKFYQNYNLSSHPTAMQAAGMAMAYRRLISKCIQANPNYFKNYGSNS